MNNYEEARAVREEAQGIAFIVGVSRAELAAKGKSDAGLDALATAAQGVMLRAGAVEAEALTAAMETIDADQFGRRVRARRQMGDLRRRKPVPRGPHYFRDKDTGEVYFISPGPVVRVWRGEQWVNDPAVTARLTDRTRPRRLEDAAEPTPTAVVAPTRVVIR